MNTPRAEQPQRPVQQRAEPKAAPQQPQQRTGEGKQQPTPRADIKGKEADTNRAARDNTPSKADPKSAQDTAKSPGKDIDRNQADRGRDRNDPRRNDTANSPGKDADRNQADRGRDRNEPGRNDTAQGKDGRDNGHSDRMAGNQDLRQARERLDTQERVRLHDAFDRRGARTNVRVNVRVGSRIPRNIHLVRVPTTVVSFFPYYRDYSYFVEDDTVYIVNPRSYEVVDVIDEGYVRQQRVQQAHLTLSNAQMALVRESIPNDVPVERINLRLALGAEIPRDVELQRFPGRLIDDVRALERYRFVLLEDQIVIVDPNDRSIALVIDRL